jgi:hypothetical protein
MSAEEFLLLSYKDQLQMINLSGTLKHSFISGDHQFTLYKVQDFYVELKRGVKDLFFEKITPIESDDLPVVYKR